MEFLIKKYIQIYDYILQHERYLGAVWTNGIIQWKHIYRERTFVWKRHISFVTFTVENQNELVHTLFGTVNFQSEKLSCRKFRQGLSAEVLSETMKPNRVGMIWEALRCVMNGVNIAMIRRGSWKFSTRLYNFSLNLGSYCTWVQVVNSKAVWNFKKWNRHMTERK